MRVYYTPPASVDVEEHYKQFPELPYHEMKMVAGPLIATHIEIQNSFFLEQMEKLKYRLMWELRHLEQEIDNENGIITIKQDHTIDLSGFTTALSEKIYEVALKIRK